MVVAGRATRLTSRFKAALEAWELANATHAQVQSFQYFRTRLDNQRALFLKWAERVGLLSPEGYTLALDSPQLRARQIGDTLDRIRIFFSNIDGLVVRYDFYAHSGTVKGDVEAEGSPGDGIPWTISQTRLGRLRDIILGNLETRARISIFRSIFQFRKKKTGMWKKVEWSILDETKAAELLAKLTTLVDTLEEMSQDIGGFSTGEEPAAEKVQDANFSSLSEVDMSSRDSATVVCCGTDAVPLRSIDAPTVDTKFSTNGTVAISQKPLLAELNSDGFNARILQQSRDQEHPENGHVNFSILEAENYQASSKLVAHVAIPPYKRKAILTEEIDSGCSRRILCEIKDWANQKTPNGWFTITPINEFKLDKFLGTIRGPAGTPYEGGIFHVRFNLNGYYPFRPPQIWFVTRILHPNIDAHGAICADILRSEWSPSYTLEKLLVSVASILDEPMDPVREARPSEWTTSRTEFNRRAKDWTQKYATGHIIFPEEAAVDFHTVKETSYAATDYDSSEGESSNQNFRL